MKRQIAWLRRRRERRELENKLREALQPPAAHKLMILPPPPTIRINQEDPTMGHVTNDAVLVTVAGYVYDQTSTHSPPMPDVDTFRATLPEKWRPLLVGPVRAVVNDDVHFAFLPDGSKDGWGVSDEGDEYRDRFAEPFAFAYDDGSSPFQVVRVSYHCGASQTASEMPRCGLL